MIFVYTFQTFHRRAFAGGEIPSTSVKELVDSEGQRRVNRCGYAASMRLSMNLNSYC